METNLNLYRFEGGYAVKNTDNNKWINMLDGLLIYGDEPQCLTDYEPEVYTSEVGLKTIPKNPKELAVALARLAIQRLSEYEKWSTPEFEETITV